VTLPKRPAADEPRLGASISARVVDDHLHEQIDSFSDPLN
jgi:hypothetical protein